MTFKKRFNVFTLAASVVFCFQVFAQTSGITGNAITLGVSSPQTGSESAVGVDYLAGARLAFDAANASGGVNGRKIELRVLDDVGKADTTLANTKKLVADGVFALFGYYGGNNTIAAIPVIDAEKIPLLGVFTGNQTLRDPPNRHIFHARTGYYAEIEHVAKNLTKMYANRIAVVHFDDRGGRDSGTRTAAEFKKLGVEVPHVLAVERGTTNVEAAAQTISASGAQWVVMILTNRTSAALIKRVRELGRRLQFMSLSFTNADALIKDMGASATGLAFAQVVPYPFSDAPARVVREFRDLAEAKKAPINYVSMEGFITARVMIEALRRSGRDLTREKLIAALDSGRAIDVGGYSVTYTPQDHTGGNFVELTVVERGGRLIR